MLQSHVVFLFFLETGIKTCAISNDCTRFVTVNIIITHIYLLFIYIYIYIYKFILHAPLQECNTTCTGVFLNNFHTLTINYLLMFLSPTNALLYYTYKMLKCTVKISHVCSYMFRSIWTIFRKPMPSLAKVTIFWR